MQYHNISVDTIYVAYKYVYYEFIRMILSNPVLRGKVRFGTDFPVNKSVAEMQAYIQNFKEGIGEKNFELISFENFKNSSSYR
jgi:hypothetical protein